MAFIGRKPELAELEALLDDVRRSRHALPGIVVAVRGGRRVGKSRLAAEFIRRARVPCVHFHARADIPSSWHLREFAEAIAQSTLGGSAGADDAEPATLGEAIGLLARAVPTEGPSVVVIDDAPRLITGLPNGLRDLQDAWSAKLASKPVLLLLLGGDRQGMEEIARPEQPWRGRGADLQVEPLTPTDLASMLGLEAPEAFDAHLMTGGLPFVALEWETGMPPRDFLHESFAWSTSALVVAGGRVLAAELPDMQYARSVLSAIGRQGERTFTGVLNAVSGGVMSRNSLTATLEALAANGVIVADEPLSTRAAPKDRRWRVADPTLRFWLAFVEPSLNDVDCDRPDAAMRRFDTRYSQWRDRAIQPHVQRALERLLPEAGWPGVRQVGSWWPRSSTPEVSLVAADAAPATEVLCAGSIRWSDSARLTSAGVSAIAADTAHVPGVDASTPLIIVSKSTTHQDERIARSWTAKDLLDAWA